MGDGAGIRSRKIIPSRSTTTPVKHGMRFAKIGPAWTKVWNSPFSPQGSISGGRSARSSWSKRRPANDGSSLRVDAGEGRLEAGVDELAGELGRVLLPEREEGGSTGAFQLPLPVDPQLLEEDVAEGDGLDLREDRLREGAFELPLVVFHAARGREHDLDQFDPQLFGLAGEERATDAMVAYPVERLGGGSDQGSRLESLPAEPPEGER